VVARARQYSKLSQNAEVVDVDPGGVVRTGG